MHMNTHMWTHIYTQKQLKKKNPETMNLRQSKEIGNMGEVGVREEKWENDIIIF